ncbi:hypothetical protein HMPREF1584_00517 [Gardnerella vaginalis JCP8481A]|nr:hypothetical protein HMPREF1584_00517 [Gardnerella vaginalis JCP8481A]
MHSENHTYRKQSIVNINLRFVDFVAVCNNRKLNLFTACFYIV